jgi:hypothetical protein
MYGKAYESMYEGSMVGAGINVFAVWNYIIAANRGGYIEINPKLLAFILGGKESDIESALEFLQKPDPKSRSKDRNGSRLVKEGQFQYFVVNWAYYQHLKNEVDRREYNRIKQAEYRSRGKTKSGPQTGETAHMKALDAGASEEALDRIGL